MKALFFALVAATLVVFNCTIGESAPSDSSVAEFFIVKSHDAIPHYHKKITEFYHVLDGSGKLMLDSEEIPLKKGVTIMINPGTTHRAVGDLSVIVVCVPAGVYQDTHEVE